MTPLALRHPHWRLGVCYDSMDTIQPLTPRQQEVLDLWLAGVTYRELAARLGISEGTVNPHLKMIARKLGTTRIAREELRRASSSSE